MRPDLPGQARLRIKPPNSIPVGRGQTRKDHCCLVRVQPLMLCSAADQQRPGVSPCGHLFQEAGQILLFLGFQQPGAFSGRQPGNPLQRIPDQEGWLILQVVYDPLPLARGENRSAKARPATDVPISWTTRSNPAPTSKVV